MLRELIKEAIQKELGLSTESKDVDDDLIGKYVIVRTYSAGVHFGILKKRKGKECTLTDTRRIYYWSGAATLSQLAGKGTSNPAQCKMPAAIDRIDLTEAIEYIPCTASATEILKGVKNWVA